MSAVDLLPCPFCNEPPTVLKKGNEHTRMSVTILCPKCRAERTDATPKAFNHANHDWLLAVATKNWNKRPIAPPVAAGSVDTEALDKALQGMQTADGKGYAGILAWGEQQREAGRAEIRCGSESMGQRLRNALERAAKAEADLVSARQIWKEYRETDDFLNARLKERVAALEAGRQALQTEGNHPAPCARHCEANAFQIEMRRLEAESAHKQAIIDRLMLEYCPNEMTVEQMAEWANHQKRAE